MRQTTSIQNQPTEVARPLGNTGLEENDSALCTRHNESDEFADSRLQTDAEWFDNRFTTDVVEGETIEQEPLPVTEVMEGNKFCSLDYRVTLNTVWDQEESPHGEVLSEFVNLTRQEQYRKMSKSALKLFLSTGVLILPRLISA